MPTLADSRYSKSLECGLAILKCFSGTRTVLGTADIGDELGMSRPTTHRYIVTLAKLGYLEQTPSRKYRLASRAADVGMAMLATTGLRKRAWPYLQELRKATSGTVGVAILDGPEIMLVAYVRSLCHGQYRVDPDFRLLVGARLPAYCTAMGKILLASLPLGAQKQVIGRMTLSKRASGTITDKQCLKEELQKIRSSNMVALCDQELSPGLQTAAVPLRRAGKTVAALGVATIDLSMTRERFVEQTMPALLDAATVVSAEFDDAHAPTSGRQE